MTSLLTTAASSSTVSAPVALFDFNSINLPSNCPWEGCNLSKTFTRKSELKKHLDKHTKPYTCPSPTCNGTRFSDKAGLRRHEGEKHSSSQHFCPLQSCPRHQRGFARRRNRDAHVTTCHKTSSASVEGNGLTSPMLSEERLSGGEVKEGMESLEIGGHEGVARRENENENENDGDLVRLGQKLKELEAREKEVTLVQKRLQEDILAVKRAMMIVSAKV